MGSGRFDSNFKISIVLYDPSSVRFRNSNTRPLEQNPRSSLVPITHHQAITHNFAAFGPHPPSITFYPLLRRCRPFALPLLVLRLRFAPFDQRFDSLPLICRLRFSAFRLTASICSLQFAPFDLPPSMSSSIHRLRISVFDLMPSIRRL